MPQNQSSQELNPDGTTGENKKTKQMTSVSADFHLLALFLFLTLTNTYTQRTLLSLQSQDPWQAFPWLCE